MPTVLFESQARDARGARESRSVLTVLVPEGGALVDTCDDHGAPVPFSCKSASCGTCRVEVLEGESELLPPAREEIEVLDLFATSAPRYRLACQARMMPGLATLRLRPLDDDE